MQAIETYIISPTQKSPYRIKARCARGSLTLSCGDERLPQNKQYGEAEFHRAGAVALMDRFHKEDVKQYGDSCKHWLSDLEMATGTLHGGVVVHVLYKR